MAASLPRSSRTYSRSHRRRRLSGEMRRAIRGKLVLRIVDGDRGTGHGAAGPHGCAQVRRTELRLGLEEGEPGNVAEVLRRSASRAPRRSYAHMRPRRDRAHAGARATPTDTARRPGQPHAGRMAEPRPPEAAPPDAGAPPRAVALATTRTGRGWRSRCARPDRALRAAPERSAAVRSARRLVRRCRDGSPTPRRRPAPAPAAA